MRKKGYVTIKDIAQALGISPSTVSRALRDLPDVKAETRAAVKALAADWHYAPNLFASSLVNSNSQLLGVVVPRINSHFFAKIISGIQESAHDQGYRVIICENKSDSEREALDVQALLSARVAGIIAGPAAGPGHQQHHWDQVRQQEVPLVFVDRDFENSAVISVVVDDFKAALKATQHLLAQGRRQILHLCGPEELTVSQRREQGFTAALKHAGLRPDSSYIRQAGFSQEGGEAAMESWLAEGRPLDAILGVNDQVCIGAMQVLKRHNIRIPEAVALIGFSDNPISALYSPSLSTVWQPAEEMGRAALALLLKQIDPHQPTPPVQRHMMDTKLIIRETSHSPLLTPK